MSTTHHNHKSKQANRVAPRSPAVVVGPAALGEALAKNLLREVTEEQVMRVLAVRASDVKTVNTAHAGRVVLDIARLQSVGNWVGQEVAKEINRLKVALISEMVKDADDTDKLFASAEKRINNAFDDLGKQVGDYMVRIGQVIAKNTKQRTAEHHGIKINQDDLDLGNTQVLGSPLQEHFDKLASDLLFRFKSVVRQGIAAGDTTEQLVKRVFGEDATVKAVEAGGEAFLEAARKGIEVVVDLMEGTSNSVNKVIQAAIQAYAKEGATGGEFEDEEDNMGWQWVAVMDANVCDRCEFYDGNRWDSEFEPVGDAPEYPDDPPLHFGCRCALVPSSLSEPASGEDFDSYLSGFSRKEQEDAFGTAALRAYRRGDITANALIGQKSNIMTLAEFEGAE